MASLTSACLNGPGFLSQDKNGRKRDKAAGPVTQAPAAADPGVASTSDSAPVLKDDGAVVTAKVSKESKGSQLVQASAGSSVAKSTVSFPPGALAVDTEVTVEEGEGIVDASLAAELGLEEDNGISTAGAPVVISSSTPIDASVPFTVSISLDGGAGLALSAGDRSLVIIAFKVFVTAESRYVVGAIPNSELSFDANGNVSFGIQYFGVYQPAYAQKAIESRIVAATESQVVVRKAATVNQPALSWGETVLKFDDRARSLACTGAPSASVQRCSVVFAKDPSFVDRKILRTGSDPTGALVIEGNKSMPEVFCRVECSDGLGRLTASGASSPVAVPAVVGTPTPTPPAPPPPQESGPILKSLGLEGGVATASPHLRHLTLNFDTDLDPKSVFVPQMDGRDGPQSDGQANVGVVEEQSGRQVMAAVSVQQRQISLSLFDSLRAGSKYKVEVGPGLRNAKGVATTAMQLQTFVVRAAAWSQESVSISAANVPIGLHRSNARGDAVVFRHSFVGIDAKRYTAASGWTALGHPPGATPNGDPIPVTADAPILGDGESEALIDARGNIIFAWWVDKQDDPPRFELRLRRWIFDPATNDGAFEPEVLLATLGSAPSIVALNANERETVVLYSVQAAYHELHGVRLAWEPGSQPISIPRPPSLNLESVDSNFVVASGDHGELVVIYKESQDHVAVFAANADQNSPPGFTWVNKVALGVGFSGTEAAAAVDGVGNAIAVIRQPDVGNERIVAATLRVVAGSGPTWTAPQSVAVDPDMTILGIGKVGLGKFDVVFQRPHRDGTGNVDGTEIDVRRFADGASPNPEEKWLDGYVGEPLVSMNERYLLPVRKDGMFAIAVNNAGVRKSPVLIDNVAPLAEEFTTFLHAGGALTVSRLPEDSDGDQVFDTTFRAVRFNFAADGSIQSQKQVFVMPKFTEEFDLVGGSVALSGEASFLLRNPDGKDGRAQMFRAAP